MPEKVAIITDTSSTIRPGEIPDVYVVSLLLSIDGKTYRDGRDLTEAEFNQALQRKDTDIKTSLPKAEDVIQVIGDIVDKYDRIVLLPISSGLSGSYNQWRTIIEQEFADKKNLYLFDSKDTAVSLRWLVENVMKILRSGAAISEVEAYVKDWHTRISCMVVLNELDRSIKGGRVGKVKGFIAKLLKIKPMLHFHDGKNKIVDKTFSNETAVKRSFEIFDKIFGLTAGDRHIVRIGVCNTFSVREQFQKALNAIQSYIKRFKIARVEQAPVTSIIGAHTGAEAFSINVLLNSKKFPE